MIPLLLRDDRKRRAWEKKEEWRGEEKGGERREMGDKGHVGTKRGHVLPKEEGRHGWARCGGRYREMGG